MENQQKLERVLGKLQQQIAQDAANYRTQIALLEVELESAQELIQQLEVLVPKDTGPTDSQGYDLPNE